MSNRKERWVTFCYTCFTCCVSPAARVRLRKGQAHTKDFMEKNSPLLVLDATESKSAFPQIAAYLNRVGQEHEGGSLSHACIQTEFQSIHWELWGAFLSNAENNFP